MAEDGGPPPKKVKLDQTDLEKMSKEELMQRWVEQEGLVEALLARQNQEMTGLVNELTGLRESSEKMKLTQADATRRENVLVMRLTNKEQQLHEYLNQIQGLKQAQTPSMTQLRAMLLDPAVNLLFQRMKQEIDTCKERHEQAQNDLAAWKFTPDSQTGKRLMAKCRMLLQENEELGKINSSGRTAKLEGEIALQKKFVEEMKSSSAETDEFLVEMDEDVEGMQGTIYLLQQQLKENKSQLLELQEENQRLHSVNVATAAAASSTAPVSSASPPHIFMNAAANSNTDSTAHELPAPATHTPAGLAPSPHPAGNASSSSSHTDSSISSLQADRTDGLTHPRAVSPPQPHTNYPVAVQKAQAVDHQPAQTTSTVTASNGEHHVTSTDTVSSQGSDEPSEQQLPEPMEQDCPQTEGTEMPDYHNNHHTSHYRTSQSSTDGVTPTEGTDLSNEAWSPMPSKPALVDDEQSRVVSSRTDSKIEAYGNEALQNGLIEQVYDKVKVEYDT